MTYDILVVEGERPAVRLLELDLRAELGDAAVAVTVAETLSDALLVLARGRWAACLLDLDLPDSQGLDTLRRVREGAAHVPVIVLSGDARQEIAVEALRLGAEDFIDKNGVPGALIARKVGHVVTRRGLTDDLRASRDELQAILDSAADGIATINECGIVQSFNPAAEEIFGWRAAEVIGRNVSMLMPADIAARHDDILRRYLDGGEARIVGVGREVMGKRKDGKTFPLHLAVSDVAVNGRRMFTGILSDLSDQKAAQAALEEEVFQRGERIKEAHCLRDVVNILLGGADRALIELLQDCVERIPDGWQAPEDTCARIAFTEGAFCSPGFQETPWSVSAEVPFPGQAAQTVRVEVCRLSAPDPASPHPHVLPEEKQLIEDIGRQLGAYFTRRAWEVAGIRAREEAEQANRAKSEFLSRMSHELRTPLNAVLGFAELMESSRKDPVTERQKEYLRYIRTGGSHLLNLINDVLDLSRIEAGHIGLSIEPVDLRPLLDHCLTAARTLGDAKGVAVIDHTAGYALPWLLADLTRVKQVLLNLLSNAVKYNRPGGTVTLAAERCANGHLRLTITDTGIGIPAARQAEVFQPFSRLGQEMGEIEGTGIGLTITRRLAREMGGDVDFTSVQGQGSTFWIELPCTENSSTAQPEGEAPPATSWDTALAQAGVAEVLYVEDNPANQALVRDILEEIGGYALRIAASAEEGLVEAARRPPHLILMDINLPGMDGFAALAALRARPETAAVPVIALSADAMGTTIQRGRDAGFFDYLTKPIRLDDLMRALAAALEARPEPAS